MGNNKITALVASYNEASLLTDCLESIQFCDTIIAVDLMSGDNTAEIARPLSTRVLKHKVLPVIEALHYELIPTLKDNWILIIDPDERIEPSLAEQLMQFVHTKTSNSIGIVYVPFQFYFKGKALRGGTWGGIKEKRLLLHKDRLVFSPNVHLGATLKHGYKAHKIAYDTTNVVHHYWMSDYKQLISKHRRYLDREGQARYEQGLRFRYVQLLRTPIVSFYEAFIKKRGYKDGLTGLFLALFWAWYNYKSRLSLKQYQQNKTGVVNG